MAHRNRWFSQLETSIYKGFSMAMLKNQMVIFNHWIPNQSSIDFEMTCSEVTLRKLEIPHDSTLAGRPVISAVTKLRPWWARDLGKHQDPLGIYGFFNASQCFKTRYLCCFSWFKTCQDKLRYLCFFSWFTMFQDTLKNCFACSKRCRHVLFAS
jgi:hypothetical protein